MDLRSHFEKLDLRELAGVMRRDGARFKLCGTGYVAESYVMDEARKAGFVLEAKFEINANPKDTRDHPFGVWTLPPTRRRAPSWAAS